MILLQSLNLSIKVLTESSNKYIPQQQTAMHDKVSEGFIRLSVRDTLTNLVSYLEFFNFISYFLFLATGWINSVNTEVKAFFYVKYSQKSFRGSGEWTECCGRDDEGMHH